MLHWLDLNCLGPLLLLLIYDIFFHLLDQGYSQNVRRKKKRKMKIPKMMNASSVDCHIIGGNYANGAIQQRRHYWSSARITHYSTLGPPENYCLVWKEEFLHYCLANLINTGLGFFASVMLKGPPKLIPPLAEVLFKVRQHIPPSNVNLVGIGANLPVSKKFAIVSSYGAMSFRGWAGKLFRPSARGHIEKRSLSHLLGSLDLVRDWREPVSFLQLATFPETIK